MVHRPVIRPADSMCLSLQDGIGFAYHGHKIVIELINEETNDLTGQSKLSHGIGS